MIDEIPGTRPKRNLLLSRQTDLLRRFGNVARQTFLFTVTSASCIAVFLIFIFIIKDALPFFKLRGLTEFFSSTKWYPSSEEAEYGALAILVGSGLVTIGAIICAVPLGVVAAICLSDILPFNMRQYVKPIIEMLASIPSVAYGFFALVILAPLIQDHGGTLIAATIWVLGVPTAIISSVLLSETILSVFTSKKSKGMRISLTLIIGVILFALLFAASKKVEGLEISSGTNAFNVSIILGIMVLPTIVSMSEDALQSVGRELREASYALGATRAETMLKVVLPAASSGICAAIILGIMRAIGETMVVWMASGNAAQIPEPWFNVFEPVRTLTATIAGDMGEADHVTGSARYHVLFVMALTLLTTSFLFNLASEWVVRRERQKLRGG